MVRLGMRIATVLFISGFCSLVYQITWLRLLRQVFGASTAASGAVVAIFMGGLGLGGWYFGRRLRGVARPLPFYAHLELGIGASAATTPFLVLAASWVYLSLGGVDGLGFTGATVVRLLLSILVLGVPAILMGGTLPAVAQAMKRNADLGRRDVAWLYGCNTLGAVCGAFLTTFFLFELFGVRQTLWLGCLLNLLLGMYVRQLAREAEEAPELTEPVEPVVARGPLSSEARWILPAAALVGFVFFLLEIVWYRLLAPILGGSSYTFGLILTLALLGIGLGGLLYALGPRNRRPTFHDLALTCALEAFCIILPFAFGDGLAWLAMASRVFSAGGFAGLAASWALVAGIVVLPTSIIAGYQFPLLIALLGGRRNLGYEVGLIYAWNTAGAILGSLAGGFGLLPLLTAPRLWWLSAFAMVLLAALFLIVGRRFDAPQSSWRQVLPIACGVISLMLCFADGPSAFWRHSPIGAGRVQAEVEDRNELRQIVNQRRRTLLAEVEGRESSIALIADRELNFSVNGKSDGSARSDAPTQVMGGLVAAMVHPKTEEMLVIGLGTGSTAGWLASVPWAERVDVVELEQAVVDFADLFAPINQNVLASPKIEVHLEDGREFVLTSDRQYDLIFSEPSNPYRAGISNLFSEDFYSMLLERLEPQGIFLQWLQGYDVDAELVQTVLSTLSSVFPYVEVWQVDDLDYLLMASLEPIDHDLARVRERAEQEPFKTALRRAWGVEGAEGFYSGYLAGPGLSRALLASQGGLVSSDDRPRVEFGFARNVGRGLLLDPESLHDLAAYLGANSLPVVGLDLNRVRDDRQLRSALETGRLRKVEFVAAEGDQRARFLARDAYHAGQLDAALRFWRQQQDTTPKTFFDRLMLAECLAEVGDPEATFHLNELNGATTEVAALKARLAWRSEQNIEAVRHLIQAFELARKDGWFHIPTLARNLELTKEVSKVASPAQAEALYNALSESFAVYLLNNERLRTRLSIAVVLGRCVEGFEPFEPFIPWEEPFLTARAACYEQSAHPQALQAFDDLALFRAQGAPRFLLMESVEPTAEDEFSPISP